MKTAIFVIGERRSGKTSLIKALTGCGIKHLWNVRTRQGKQIVAFVVFSALQEDKKLSGIAPAKFPKVLEDRYQASPHDYELLICPSK